MTKIPQLPPRVTSFVGRKRELEELRERIEWGHHNSAFTVIGPAGTGKTALVREALEKQPRRLKPLWFSFSDISGKLEDFNTTLRETLTGEAFEDFGPFGTSVIILDGVDDASEKELERLQRIIFNYKRVGSIIATSRSRLSFRGREMHLRDLTFEEKREILQSDLTKPISELQLQALIEKAGALPLGLSLVSELLKKHPADQVLAKLDGQVYDLKESEESQIVQVVRPKIVSFSNELIVQLQKSPNKLHEVNSRQFEHLVAELFHDMGWEVELTKATRDGGRDILAHLNTGVMKMLCLIEAKKHREDRPVGVQLVRNLYGTFCDEQANSAMLVTSSYFSAPAKQFQEKHKYQLALKDYADVVGWVANYKNSAKAVKLR